jgi:AcrR family transcriptional regulator
MKDVTSEQVQDRRVRRTRKAIREALQTLLQDHSIEQITVKEIAAEADIGYTTFFRHFATKEAALADLADYEAEELIGHCFPLLGSIESRAVSLVFCQHIDGRRRVWTALLTGGAASIVRQAMVRHTLERSNVWPQSRSWLPAESGPTLVIGLLVEVLGWWLSHARDLTPEQLSEIMDRLFISQLVGTEN